MPSESASSTVWRLLSATFSDAFDGNCDTRRIALPSGSFITQASDFSVAGTTRLYSLVPLTSFSHFRNASGSAGEGCLNRLRA